MYTESRQRILVVVLKHYKTILRSASRSITATQLYDNYSTMKHRHGIENEYDTRKQRFFFYRIRILQIDEQQTITGQNGLGHIECQWRRKKYYVNFYNDSTTDPGPRI